MSEQIYSDYQAYRPKGRHLAMKPTPPDIEGPFYLAGAPIQDHLCDNPTLHLHGKIFDTDGNPASPAGDQLVLDFWQADANGVYDENGYKFRGKVIARFSDLGNTYSLHTIRPGDYKISDTEFRCSHIHVKVTCPGFISLTTQIYFRDDPFNQTDHWFDASRVIKDGPVPSVGIFDFVLKRKKS